MSGHFLRAAYSIVAIFLCVGGGSVRAEDLLFVANNLGHEVTVYARTANGNVAPLRTLSGPATGLNQPYGLAVDTVNNELLVSNAGTNSITVYALTASGNAAPLRTLSGAATGLSYPINLAVDSVNNELAVVNYGSTSIATYARTANGNVAPLRTLSGAATGLSYPVGLAVDLVNNELTISNAIPYSVRVYARTANGNVAPLRTLAGPTTGLIGPIGLAVDTVNNELAVVSNGTPGVLVYARTANGDVAPLRTLAGPATGLNQPYGLVVDTLNNELLVANVVGLSVTVYPRTANGDIAPLRTLSGPATGLNNPTFMALGTGADVQPAGLVEDAHTGATISNVNNILEPGETVLANPSWTNTGVSPLALTGTASALTGPVGAMYTLLDSVADYGTITPGATGDSFTPGGPSYRLFVSNPVTRPEPHWDATFLETLSTGDTKTWTLHIGESFSDVPVGHVAYPYIENIFHNGITTGYGNGTFGPNDPLPRWQGAVLLARAMLGPGVPPPTAGTVPLIGPYNCTSGVGGISLFGDVAPTDVACPHIHYIYSQGVTQGYGNGNFGPYDPLPRWQMAILLVRAFHMPFLH